VGKVLAEITRGLNSSCLSGRSLAETDCPSLKKKRRNIRKIGKKYEKERKQQ